jgi:LysR family transcriptional activator of glutamate synthase operon
MEMLQLRYFYDSAKYGSFKKTAEKYIVPQTSVSAAVKRLENELGQLLFDRTSNKIILNQNGKLLLKSLEEIFEKLDETVSIITSAKSDKRIIKMLVCAIRGQITNKIIEYKTNHPEIDFKTVFDFDETNLSEYDIIIDEKSDKYPLYECTELFTADVRLYVAKNSPLYGKKLTLKELKGEDFVSIGENNGLTKILISACKRVGFSPNFAVQSNDVSCTKRCVEAGVGIGLARVVRNRELRTDICYLDVSDFNESQTLCVYYKKSAAYGNVKHFLDFLIGEKF